MKWEHECSLQWMKARQRFLCASDVRKLVPFTKTGRPRKITDIDRYKVWSEKNRILTTDDCISTGAAARGHMLEPYAIDEFNDLALSKNWNIVLHHWDDVVVHKHGDLAYSPDAMNAMQNVYKDNICNLHHGNTIGEIKSYSSEKHIEALCTPKMELEERWQIATAMAADEDIKIAYLIFFNPSLLCRNIGVYKYTIAELQQEIEQVKQVELEWANFVNRISAGQVMSNDCTYCISGLTEEDIIKDIDSKKSNLNPV